MLESFSQPGGGGPPPPDANLLINPVNEDPLSSENFLRELHWFSFFEFSAEIFAWISGGCPVVPPPPEFIAGAESFLFSRTSLFMFGCMYITRNVYITWISTYYTYPNLYRSAQSTMSNRSLSDSQWIMTSEHSGPNLLSICFTL